MSSYLSSIRWRNNAAFMLEVKIEIYCQSASHGFKIWFKKFYDKGNGMSSLWSGCRTTKAVSERWISSDAPRRYFQGREIQDLIQVGLGWFRNCLACEWPKVSIFQSFGKRDLEDNVSWCEADSVAMLPLRYQFLNFAMMTARFKYSITYRMGLQTTLERPISYSCWTALSTLDQTVHTRALSLSY